MRDRRSRPLINTALAVALGVTATNIWAQDVIPPNNEDPPSATDRPDKRRYTWLRINAFTDVPLDDADVEVYDAAGRRLFKRNNATNSMGVFPAKVQNLPRVFRVTVTWDGDHKRDWNRKPRGRLTLSSDVQNFDPIHGIVHVNVVTTMVSRLLDRFPRLRIEQAQALVRRYLGLPSYASLGAALREGKRFRSRYFSHKAFLAESVKYGGVEPLLNYLVTEQIARPEKRRLFAPAPAPQGIFSSAASWAAEKLAGAALSWAAGQGMGWAAKSTGLITPGATIEDIANLQHSLADLQSSVDELSKEVAALRSLIEIKFTQTQLQIVVTPATELATHVDGVAGDVAYLAQQCPALSETGERSPDSASEEFCRNWKTFVVGELSTVEINHSFETLASYVLDNQTSSSGMLHLYSQLLGQTVRFFRPADSTKIQDTFDYWYSIQTQAAALKVELLHLSGAQDDPVASRQLTDFLGFADANPPTKGTFQKTIDQEAKLVFPPVPAGTVIDTETKLMWKTDYPTFYPDCSTVSPPSAGTTPITSSITWNGMVGWSSPLLVDLRTLVRDGGNNPMPWLIDQTKAVAPESPESPGFSDIVYRPNDIPHNACTANVTSVWAADPATPVSGHPAAAALDFRNGGDTSSVLGVYLWIFIRRPLDVKVGEQYYWYP